LILFAAIRDYVATVRIEFVLSGHAMDGAAGAAVVIGTSNSVPCLATLTPSRNSDPDGLVRNKIPYTAFSKCQKYQLLRGSRNGAAHMGKAIHAALAEN
jgi:hypothetical protein